MPAIERLPSHEFDLDIEEQRKLKMECDFEVQKVIMRMVLMMMLKNDDVHEIILVAENIIAISNQFLIDYSFFRLF